tara:strand:- start:7325 stop:7519 length:195 start_codon:yes stop_codon:yes gene_type:complete
VAESEIRRKQKRDSRIRNNMTTMQISSAHKAELIAIKEKLGFDSADEALGYVLAENNHLECDDE